MSIYSVIGREIPKKVGHIHKKIPVEGVWGKLGLKKTIDDNIELPDTPESVFQAGARQRDRNLEGNDIVHKKGNRGEDIAFSPSSIQEFMEYAINVGMNKEQIDKILQG